MYELLGLDEESLAPEVKYEHYGVSLDQWSQWLSHDVEVELHVGVPLIFRRAGVTKTPYLEHYVRLVCQSPQGGSSAQLARMGTATYHAREPGTPGFSLDYLRHHTARSSSSSSAFSSSPTSTPIRALLSSWHTDKTPRGIKREPSSPTLSTPTKRPKKHAGGPSSGKKREVTPADVIEISDDEEPTAPNGSTLTAAMSIAAHHDGGKLNSTKAIRKGYKIPKDAEVIDISD